MMEGDQEVISESQDSLRECETTKLLSDPQQTLSQGEDTNSSINTLSSTRQWIILVSLLSLQFLTLSIDTFLLPFFTEKALEKGLHEIQIGVVFCTYNLSRFVGATVLVSWIMQFKAHRVCMVGGILTSASCIAFGSGVTSGGSYVTLNPKTPFAKDEKENKHPEAIERHWGLCALTPDGPWFFSLCLLIRLAAGIGSGMLTTTCTSVLLKSTSFTPSTIMAAMESMVGAGYATGPAMGSLLYKYMGYTGCFIPLGVLTLLSTFISVLALPDIKQEEKDEKRKTGNSFLRLMTIPGIMMIFMSVLALKTARHGTSIFLAHFLTSQFSVDISIVGLVFAAGAVCYTIASFISARLINKTGAGWSQMIVSWFVITLSFLLMTPSPLLNFIFHGKRFLALTITSYIVTSVAQAGIYVPPLEIALNIASLNGYVRDDRRTYTMVSGMVHGGISLGAAISPLLAGLVTQLINYDWFVTMSAFISLFMLLLTVLYLITMRLLGKPLK